MASEVFAGEQTVKLAAKLYEARDAMRALLGEKYASAMADTGAAISDMAKKSGAPPLSAAVQLAKACADDGDGFAALRVMAAAVEMIEPTNPTRTPNDGDR